MDSHPWGKETKKHNSSLIRVQHQLRTNLVVELLRRQEPERYRGLLQRRALLVRLLCTFRHVYVASSAMTFKHMFMTVLTVVAKVAVQNGGEHERLVQELVDAGLIRLNANNAVLREAAATIRKQSNALQYVLNHDRLEDVELEVAVAARNRHSGVVAHDLGGHHGQCLALRRVDLARHDRASGLVLRQRQLTETATGARAEEADVVRNLHE
jgi:hypothetical protein